MNQPGALPNFVAFADPGGKSLRRMLYRSFVMFGFKVADSEDLVGVVHELSAILRHWLSAGLDWTASKLASIGGTSGRLPVNPMRRCRALAQHCESRTSDHVPGDGAPAHEPQK